MKWFSRKKGRKITLQLSETARPTDSFFEQIEAEFGISRKEFYTTAFNFGVRKHQSTILTLMGKSNELLLDRPDEMTSQRRRIRREGAILDFHKGQAYAVVYNYQYKNGMRRLTFPNPFGRWLLKNNYKECAVIKGNMLRDYSLFNGGAAMIFSKKAFPYEEDIKWHRINASLDKGKDIRRAEINSVSLIRDIQEALEERNLPDITTLDLGAAIPGPNNALFFNIRPIK